MLKHVESIVLLVPNVAAAARWFAEIFSVGGTTVYWEVDSIAEARPHNHVFGEGFVPARSNPAHELRIRFPDSRRRVAPVVAGPA